GKLGGQAEVKGVAGTWKDLTDNVNSMASNLTGQVRNIAEVSTAIANGDLSKKITVDVRGEILELKNTLNSMVDQLNSFASEVTRVAREVGTEGKLGGQADVKGVAGTWKDLTDNVNSMASNLTGQVRNIAEVTKAIANGDLSKKITVDVRGEILELKNTLNSMVDQLNSFASEVTRVAGEVGTEGKLGGQADVKGVAGTWKDLTDNVNLMANNLTEQVRGLARVVTAVANGNLKQKLALAAKGEIATLADTINEMIDTLATFADQVTTVAREVGIEGKLGGQASVPSAAGIWRHLTDNVNQLAANLTTQVRAIAEVATAVTKGDLTRSITVSAQGEVAELSDNINQMIANLRETTQKNNEQDWLKTNLAKFTRMLQGQRELESVSRQILSELAPLVSAQHGVFYHMTDNSNMPMLKLLSSYAYKERKHLSNEFRVGEGLVGQCALEKQRILITDVPADYIKINSGLGEASPLNMVVLPVLFEGEVTAVIELASFHSFSEIRLTFLDQLAESIGIVLNTVAANMRTETLLTQSQSLAEELQSQQAELTETNRRLELQARSLQASEELLRNQQDEMQKTNSELEEKARLLALQNNEVERKNHEVEQAKRALEEKAEQLALTSKYKSEFLANMSHELRTPLNSMLILSKLLTENAEGHLTPKQVDFAQTIYMSGTDLLSLINDILDLTKIESGMMVVEIDELRFSDLRDFVERSFSQVAQNKGLDFAIELDPNLPQVMHTDTRRLQQVLKNLLSNAFKFTERGHVSLQIGVTTTKGWSFDHEILNRADMVVSFAVADTGIGIPADKQKIIFESFQQADGTTSRTYGGTGLGLSISREIARLLGGEIRVISTVGKGSTFTLYLPLKPLPSGTLTPHRHSIEDSVQSKLQQIPARVATARFPKGESSVFSEPDISTVKDDREDIRPGDRSLLIIEDDPYFAEILVNFAREKGFKAVVALRGDTGFMLARELNPSAITLDIKLPSSDGWTVLDRLKHDQRTRHIPVHVISVAEGQERGLQLGALAYLQKPVSKEALIDALTDISNFVDRQIKKLLIVAGNGNPRNDEVELLGGSDIAITAVHSGAEALAAIKQEQFDCLVMDVDLADMSGFDLIAKIEKDFGLWEQPIIVYTEKNLTLLEEAQVKRLAKTMPIKNVHSQEGLLDETTLLLHRREANLAEPSRRILEQRHKINPSLSGKKILIIDDDIRNIFATTSLLEHYNMQVIYAENGREGINTLEQTQGIDLVLMDIMMPGMDGYETMRTIRASGKFKTLPIIALTAKAMKGDREKCVAAGASDYITKPIDTDQLLSLCRVWLYRKAE
ncbi:MAG: response regulator, partial [Aggregatilineales bacterium]